MNAATLRRLATGAIVPVVSLSVLLAAGPAHAGGSAVGIANNAWIVTDLAIQAGSNLNTTPAGDASVPAGVWDQQKTATTTTVDTPGKAVKVKPKVSGKLGLIVNSVAVLGGLAAFWPGGEDAPVLPAPSTTPGTRVGTDNGCSIMVATAYVLTSTCTTTGTGAQAVLKPSVTADWSQQPVSTTQNEYVCAWWIAGHAQVTSSSTFIRRSCHSPNDPMPVADAKAVSEITATHPVDLKYSLWIAPGIEPLWDGNLKWIPANATRVAVAEWARPGGTLAPATAADPATTPRTIVSSANCVNSATGLAQTIVNNSSPFTINPGNPAGTELPETEDLKCPDGHWLESGKRELQTAGTQEKVAIGTPYTAPAWVPTQVQNYPDCYPAGATVCRLSLNRIDTEPRYSCDSIPVGSGGHPCRDWLTDPSRALKYDCTFGAYAVALSRCGGYANSFKAGGNGAATQTTTSTSELPPVTGADPTSDDEADNPNADGCIPEWKSLLNPFWVFKAMSCALVWAFVPEDGYLAGQTDTIRAKLEDSAPAEWLGAITGLVSVPSGNGCDGIPLDVEIGGTGVGVHERVGYACTGKLAPIAPPFKLGAAAFVTVYGALACSRTIMRAFGFTVHTPAEADHYAAMRDSGVS